MKKIIVMALALTLTSCAELNKIVQSLPAIMEQPVSSLDISNGLKEALNKGITDEVSKLTQEKGFYSNDLVRIALPDELKKVDETLRKFGLGDLADKGLIALNATAEDAVKTATPIFVDAVKQMSFNDAKNILMGDNKAATTYLTNVTNDKLYASFNPVIKQSFDKVGAAEIWTNLITKYNQIPFISKVNPDLTDYVTEKALEGVYTMIAIEEQKIRTNISERSSVLLKKVFALQD
ncbi:DUF4197 domain-containing protein [Wenyingzhuangia sp. 2_MG-2023]|uniref:DUF4197 domain-containing protein n=1 Tax=Wenyingzhuangia sp. 2_MG-2023 TaxID=3062639 RepID=UPI0026E18B3D|nr:DUF4197 domain-containing protein [Wenyingzhuangia sp. 2_MG-2023]MDO6736271.1 DUF4197 domain-containing protein [Wenyingzhuangia sp. 2_MG-2023]